MEQFWEENIASSNQQLGRYLQTTQELGEKAFSRRAHPFMFVGLRWLADWLDPPDDDEATARNSTISMQRAVAPLN